ncbi:hypothetical protein EJ066_28375 [Mesorhizobium sp. M9A.F.Ca.ET.002.03.1.2]|uniref:choice-of-anchor X domain-containing protein n=1 Tax=Mesorhizobium sp. M9A.F.Ca.ET.002.03.1.2 TaxID=2493668 RepID=UPI000F75FE87|nr:choice-of-anchor X domain-containing protein [Mesorhizobium sp. M9A.F.Ca.ET.002.03.1.2]AZO00707.1 hypothetical protein EJ066_28375 [Mesorhizobium sp. M9A.F.Ca.ET.002.03.1.2]
MLPLLVATPIASNAQENSAGSPTDPFLGLDPSSFDRIFGEALRRKPPPPSPATSPEMLANNVTELRVFLTQEPGVVVGEIATTGPSTLTEFPVALEDGVVTFRDDGAEPDREKGDGVFTAQFKFDATGEFAALRADLAATIDGLGEQQQNTGLIRRGPRDIVTTAAAASDAELKMVGPLNEARKGLEWARGLRDSQDPDPLRAAQGLEINIGTTPFLRLPGPRFHELLPQRFRVEYLFDFPIFPGFPPPLPTAIDHERSLLITATDVVEDSARSFDACSGLGSPGGAWSFGHLMRELANGTGLTPEEFTRHWLSSWQIPQEANGWIVTEPARAMRLQSLVIDNWRALSPGGVFNVDYFPARLLAIVNRPDLADRIGYGTAGSAGEGRLVFGLVYHDPASNSCNPMNFTVIFEYGIAAGSCMEVKAWHRRWKDLDQFTVGSAAYNQALESITRAVTDHGSNPGQLPNMSSLSQLRTNETVLSVPWQLREFRLQQDGLLDLVTVKQTPDNQFNSSAILRTYLGINEAAILDDRHVVPERFPTMFDRFLGAVSNTDVSSYFWWVPNPSSTLADPLETRRKFSLATCNGCHSGETATQFTHIGTRDMATPAQLSGFLLGEDITVPQGGGTHHYEDLTEREIAMSNLLGRSCLLLLGFRRLPFVH